MPGRGPALLMWTLAVVVGASAQAAERLNC
ncbi:hypothetical protein BH10PSE8_BH10PSE8_23230 [soil metagenome]